MQELRKLKQQIEQQRDREQDLNEELKEMTQNYLKVKAERDLMRLQLSQQKAYVDNLQRITAAEVQTALQQQSQEYRKNEQSFNEQIQKLQEHIQCYRETVSYLETQNKDLKEQKVSKLEASFSERKHKINMVDDVCEMFPRVTEDDDDVIETDRSLTRGNRLETGQTLQRREPSNNSNHSANLSQIDVKEKSFLHKSFDGRGGLMKGLSSFISPLQLSAVKNRNSVMPSYKSLN